MPVKLCSAYALPRCPLSIRADALRHGQCIHRAAPDRAIAAQCSRYDSCKKYSRFRSVSM